MKANKILSALISMAIIISCIPSMAFAEETDGIAPEDQQEVGEEPEEIEESVNTEEPEDEPAEEPLIQDEEPDNSEQIKDETKEELPQEEIIASEETEAVYGDVAADPVSYEYNYFDYNKNKVVMEFLDCTEYTVLSSVADTSNVTLSNGVWYVLDSDRTYNNRIEISGEVNIILVNNYKLSCMKGIHVGENATLNIFGQPRYLGNKLGELHAEVNLSDNSPIGGNNDERAGVINIFSGKVDAIAYSSYSAAIGGGRNKYNLSEDYGSVKSINIYGGEVSAINNNFGAGIGGGEYGGVSWSEENGSGINIFGGKITTQGQEGAGIGSGPKATGTKGTISIRGGSIDAVGYGSSAAIGSGMNSSNGKICIYGGTVKAVAKGTETTGAGIGSGYKASQTGEIHIYDGVVYATSLQGAGIGSGCQAPSAGTVKIDHGVICASSTEGGAGIGGGKFCKGGDVTIGGGAVSAISCAYDTSEESSYNTWMDYAMNAYCMQYEPGNDFAYLCIELFAYISTCCSDSVICGAGIGGGYEGNGNKVTITYGFVSARTSATNNSSAIGRGSGDIENPSNGTIEISDGLSVTNVYGQIKETADYNDRITTCYDSGVEIKPCDTTDHYRCVWQDDEYHKFVCSYCGKKLRTEEHHFDADHNCTRCGEGAVRTVMNYVTKDIDGKTLYSNDDGYLNEDYTLRTCTTAPEGKEFTGWHISYEPNDPGEMYDSGETFHISTNRVYCFEAVYCKSKEVSYIDKNGNSQTVTARVIDSEVKGLNDEWYVTESGVDIGSLCYRGNVSIILADDTSLTIDNNCALKACDQTSKIAIYGQSLGNGKLKTDTIMCYAYEQYGGAVESVYFYGHGLTRIKCGSFTCGSLDLDYSFYIDGGNIDIVYANLYNSSSILFGWTKLSDSIHFGRIDLNRPIVIKPGQRFTDGKRILSDNVFADDVSGKILVPYDGYGALLAGHRVSLEGDIGLWFYMLIDESILETNAAMRLTVPQGGSTYTEEIRIADAPIEEVDGVNYRVFKCNVSAKDITVPVEAQIINAPNDGRVYSYSVCDYARYLLEHTDDNDQYREAAELVRALINYGAYAQTYFGVTPDIPANAGYEYTDEEMENVLFDDPGCTVSNLPEEVTFEGASLSLLSESGLSLYFKSTGEDKLTFTCLGREDPEYSSAGGYQIARIKGIKANELGSTFTVVVNGQGEVTYSPLTYCAKVMDMTGNPGLCDMCKTLVLYYQAAQKYIPEE